MTRFPSSIHRLYKRLFKWWCCSPEFAYVSVSPFWGPRTPYWSIPIFVLLGKYICTSTIQSQHFFIFFAFHQDLDGVDYIQDTAHLEALNTFLNGIEATLCHSGRTDPLHTYLLFFFFTSFNIDHTNNNLLLYITIITCIPT